MLHAQIDQLNDGLAVTLKEGYVQKVETFNENLQSILNEGFRMTRDEVFEFLSSNEKSAYDYTVKELKSAFASAAPQSLLRKFNASFKQDENGKLREWNAIEEKKI
mmetsp:Transcript_33525/g.44175  ORF Transcript_33525/g.44175 Transcript_33525/m.44175 type:complete len:106 (-) Transcript_33525:695-1012(-)